jgi:hypothetical protein
MAILDHYEIQILSEELWPQLNLCFIMDKLVKLMANTMIYVRSLQETQE